MEFDHYYLDSHAPRPVKSRTEVVFDPEVEGEVMRLVRAAGYRRDSPYRIDLSAQPRHENSLILEGTLGADEIESAIVSQKRFEGRSNFVNTPVSENYL